jgi:hypothetical protein
MYLFLFYWFFQVFYLVQNLFNHDAAFPTTPTANSAAPLHSESGHSFEKVHLAYCVSYPISELGTLRLTDAAVCIHMIYCQNL